MLDRLVAAEFDVRALHHAEAILTQDMPAALAEIEEVLLTLRIPVAELVAGGGGEAKSTQRLRRAFAGLGWRKQTIQVRKLVNDREVTALSHEIDHFKAFAEYAVALEIEWNNKDPFFDRDLESFKRLHAEGALSVGVIVTRGRTLQAGMRTIIDEFATRHAVASFADLVAHGYEPSPRQRANIEKRMRRPGTAFATAWVEEFVADKFGEATTHWRKLDDRVRRGVGNPCPLLLIGIPLSVVTP